MKTRLPVMPKQCATCPWRDDSPYRDLREYLTCAAMRETRICHSTGKNAINRRTGRPRMICRGARNFQLQVFARIGVIESATDEAWERKCKEL